MDLTELWGRQKKLNASDLHITVGVPPQVRVNGARIAMETAETDGDDTQELVESIMGERQKSLFEDKGGGGFLALESRHWAGSGLMPSARGEQLQQHSVW